MSRANATGVKVSACVDCATPIIGERLRCPACHDAHVAQLSSSAIGDEDVTLPRGRQRKMSSARDALVAWLGACLIVTVVAVLLVAAGRSCQ